MLDVSTLKKAYPSYGIDVNHPDTSFVVWSGEAHGVKVAYLTYDLDAEFWVSPIWTMREKGVALVDKNGNMVKNERRDR
jgi:hypothetical protein